MKKGFAIGLFIIFCFTEISPLLPFANYYINFKYISEVLCINKEEQIPTCKGSCYLNDQLKKNQKTDNPFKTIFEVKAEKIPILLVNNPKVELAIKPITINLSNTEYRFFTKDISFSPPTPPPQC